MVVALNGQVTNGSHCTKCGMAYPPDYAGTCDSMAARVCPTCDKRLEANKIQSPFCPRCSSRGKFVILTPAVCNGKVEQPGHIRIKRSKMDLPRIEVSQVARCPECGTFSARQNVGKRCLAILHHCPKCHQMVQSRNLLGDTCPNCIDPLNGSRFILRQPGQQCSGVIILVTEDAQAE